MHDSLPGINKKTERGDPRPVSYLNNDSLPICVILKNPGT